jgi:hypothetical protein
LIIDNLDKIIGLTGVVIGIELVAAAMFMLSIVYFRSPQIAGLIGNLTILSLATGLIAYFLKKG